MGVSGYIARLREHVGHDLILIPGAAALVVDDEGRILVVRRADDGNWGLPCGAIEPGEHPADAVVRETREETGLEVTPEWIAGVFGGLGQRHVYPNRDEIEATTIVFGCTVRGGSFRLQEGETTRLEFVSPETAAERIPTFPPVLFTGQGRRSALFDPPGA